MNKDSGIFYVVVMLLVVAALVLCLVHTRPRVDFSSLPLPTSIPASRPSPYWIGLHCTDDEMTAQINRISAQEEDGNAEAAADAAAKLAFMSAQCGRDKNRAGMTAGYMMAIAAALLSAQDYQVAGDDALAAKMVGVARMFRAEAKGLGVSANDLALMDELIVNGSIDESQ